MMHMVQIPKGVAPCQVEDFPEGCKRSKKGALHFRVGSMRLTEDEYNHVLKTRPDLSKMLLVHTGETAAEKKATAKAKAPAKAEAKAKPEEAKPVEEAKERPKTGKKHKAQS